MLDLYRKYFGYYLGQAVITYSALICKITKPVDYEKIRSYQKYKKYNAAKPTPEIVKIDPVQCLSIGGKGDPSGNDFSEHLKAFYSTAYTLKFFCKAAHRDFTVPKLEALWWFDTQKV